MFKRLLFVSALLIAMCAGFFSISGIGQLFIGAPISAMVMAASLELGKLVTVSFVYRYWERCSRPLRVYFVAAAVVLMAITSTGVYGYLSAAYAKAAVGVLAVQNEVSLISTRQKSIDGSIGRLEARAKTLEGTRSQQENRLDKLVGHRGLSDQQGVIRQADKQLSEISTQISDLSRQRDSLESKKMEVQNNLSSNSKIGTFWYIAKSLGVELDFIVHWFILAIVLVFDPLSITLIIAYNMIDADDDTESTPNRHSRIAVLPPDSEHIPVEFRRTWPEEMPTAMELAEEFENESILHESTAPTSEHVPLVSHPPDLAIGIAPQYRPTDNGGIDIT